MRIFATCMSCQAELGHPSFEPFFAPYYDDRVATIKCSRGHESLVMLQSQKFEVLLESGANALRHGFTLEAAATFSAALERFIEFSAKVMLVHLGMTEPRYEEMFAEMARQSERQTGSFLALHALVLGAAFAPNKEIAPLRNAVIHKGKIPTPEEVEKFCRAVYAEIYRTLVLLKEHCEQSIQYVIWSDIRARHSKIPKGVRVATAAVSGLLSLSDQSQKPSFDEALAAYTEMVKSLEQAAPQMQSIHKILFPASPDA